MLKKTTVILFFIIGFWNITEPQHPVLSDHSRPVSSIEYNHIHFDEDFINTTEENILIPEFILISFNESKINIPERIYPIWKPPVIS